MDRTDRPVVVIGAGGHALVVTETLRAAGRRVRGWVSNGGPAAAPMTRLGLESLGGDDALRRIVADGTDDVFVAIGDNQRRAAITDELSSAGARFAPAISPAATVSPTAAIAPGVLVMPGAVVNALAELGPGVIVNTGASVDHECIVGAFAHLAPRSALAGSVQVGDGAFVGIGAVVIPGRSLGAWSVVGAGAVVIDDVPEGATAVGVPARVRA